MLWGPFPQVGALKVGTSDMWPKPFTPEGEVGAGSFLLIGWCCARSGVYDVNVSQLFLLNLMYFLSHLVFRSALNNFLTSLRGN